MSDENAKLITWPGQYIEIGQASPMGVIRVPNNAPFGSSANVAPTPDGLLCDLDPDECMYCGLRCRDDGTCQTCSDICGACSGPLDNANVSYSFHMPGDLVDHAAGRTARPEPGVFGVNLCPSCGSDAEEGGKGYSDAELYPLVADTIRGRRAAVERAERPGTPADVERLGEAIARLARVGEHA